jgi:hypothetical protein
MLIEHDLLQLFRKFITASRSGKRRKKNGEKITGATIDNYNNTLKLLQGFAEAFPLIVYELKGNSKKDFQSAKKYYGRLYKSFCEHLGKKYNAVNNYTGHNIKIIRSFFNWCQSELGVSLHCICCSEEQSHNLNSRVS